MYIHAVSRDDDDDDDALIIAFPLHLERGEVVGTCVFEVVVVEVAESELDDE